MEIKTGTVILTFVLLGGVVEVWPETGTSGANREPVTHKPKTTVLETPSAPDNFSQKRQVNTDYTPSSVEAVEVVLPSAELPENSPASPEAGRAKPETTAQSSKNAPSYWEEPVVVEDLKLPEDSLFGKSLPKSKQKKPTGASLIEPPEETQSGHTPVVSVQIPPERPTQEDNKSSQTVEPLPAPDVPADTLELEVSTPKVKKQLFAPDVPAETSSPMPDDLPASGASLGFKVSDLKMTPRPEHKNKVYTAPNKDIFWPMDFPVWIRLATSPRDDAPNFLLQNLYQDKEGKTERYQKEGIKLEIPGRQFVRWVNHLTQDETMFKFIADGKAPESDLRLHDSPKFSGEKHTFYGKGLTATLTSIDDLSGVKEDFVSVDGYAFLPYSQPLKLDVEKNYHLRYYAVDRVGYAAEPKFATFIVDHTPPISKYKIVRNHDGDILSVDTIIYLSSRDALSGVDKIHYYFDNDNKSSIYNAKKGIPVKPLADGKHTLYFDAIDKVENLERTHQYSFYLDRTAPQPEHSSIGDLYTTEKKYISRRTRIMLKADDGQVKVKSIEYQINKDSYLEYQKPFAPPITGGEFSISYRSTDYLNNRSVPKVIKLVMDSTPPKTKYSLTGSSYTQGGGVIWITDKTKIFLSAKDDLSGVQKIEYQIAKNPVVNYAKPIITETEGQYLFRYWSTDNVNNREMFTPILLMVDKTPPEILTIFSIDPVRSIKEGGKVVKVYPLNTTLFLSAIDNSANVRELLYSLDGSKMQRYKDIMFFDDPGRHKLTVKSVDNVDNEIIEHSEFIIADEQ